MSKSGWLRALHGLALGDISGVAASVSTPVACPGAPQLSHPHERLVSSVLASSPSGWCMAIPLVVLICASLKTNGELLITYWPFGYPLLR